MTAEDEVIHLRHTNTLLQEQVEAQRETIRVQQAQIAALTKQVQELQARLAKDSHNSHLSPSSDRFSRQPKSLRKKSGKKPGAQEGHPGKTLLFSPSPDEVIVHAVERCEQCQADLRQVHAIKAAPQAKSHSSVAGTTTGATGDPGHPLGLCG